ncbi:MAG: protein adenylyltransferase SelO [Wenzhouxiangella sp.]
MNPSQQRSSSTTPMFDNSYARLSAQFYDRLDPTPVAAPKLIEVNHDLAISLGIDPHWLSGPEGLEFLAGNRLPPSAEPLAMAYAGHQFGNWVPRLGDGRALLLGEVIDREGVRRDVQLKGSGPTPYSRGGDGRSSIGPVVREYLGSEAMAALGIPTTRALGAVATGEQVMRERPEPGGILCRVATSHVRIGTFEYFARNNQPEAVRRLADYVIDRHYPELVQSDQPYRALLDAVLTRTANLVASWMLVGFVHGVMNTDNSSVVGETIDYGPFGYIDAFDPATVYSYIDRRGRYAWNQQPGIAHWNLARLAECLLGLLADDEQAALEVADDILGRFPDRFTAAFDAGLAAKIGLAASRDGDAELALDLLDRMAGNNADMTLTFRRLSALPKGHGDDDGFVRELFDQPEAFDQWARTWRQRLAGEQRSDSERRQAMESVNPAFILRNHLAQRAVDASIEQLDFGPMRELNRVLARPYQDQPEFSHLSLPPEPHERVRHTFCGT